MTRTETVLPPRVLLTPEGIFAIQGDIYALEPTSGAVQYHYPVEGLPELASAHGVLYLNVTRGHKSTAQAVRAIDGALLWEYPVDDGLAGLPAIGNDMFYAGTRHGDVLALRLDDGSLRWRYSVGHDPGTPSFQRPILFKALAVAGEIVYLAPAANPPLQPSLFALQTTTGQLLWQVPLPESTTHELTIFDETVYLSTHYRCCAIHASSGATLWSQTLQEHGNLLSRPIVTDEAVYVSSLQFTSSFAYDTSTWTHHKQVHLHSRRRADGTSLWNTQLAVAEEEQPISVTEPAAAQTSLFVGTDDGVLAVLDRSTGLPRWRYQTTGTRLSTPVFWQQNVLVGVNDGSVLALRVDDGTLLWRTPLNGKKITVVASLTLISDTST